MPAEATAPGSGLSGSDFEHQLSVLNIIPPGQSYYAARRSLWLSTQSKSPSDRKQMPESVARLENMISEPWALRSRQVWEAGLRCVWKGLVEGGRLKHNLPLPILIKILYAGWIRDGTWPQGAEAPDTPPA